ncbi:MAG: hypothetical protein JNM43_14930 [Planctomycetaceae bacterium]|nr:hypothetical protein [Planctomycetaceae bacterium]
MPANNQFQHQQYPTTQTSKPWLRKLTAEPFPESHFSRLHTKHQVSRVVLVHGTFVGDDPLGLSEILRTFSTGLPLIAGQLRSFADLLEERTKPLTAGVMKDIGNYTDTFRKDFQRLVGPDPIVELLTPSWSSQNHHFARADLAVRLLAQLIQRPLPESQKVLLWGHSHAGNSFAMLSNLLANHRPSVQQFFEACAGATGEHWQIASRALENVPSPHPLAKQIVVVTFETPVRYGWDTQGLHRLVHVCYHRVFDEQAPEKARPLFPPHGLNDMMFAQWGDWVQSFAIAGTDSPTLPSKPLHDRLAKLLERNLEAPVHGLDTRFITTQLVRDTCARWKTGTRCHSDGLNLLLDYHPTGLKTPMGWPIEQSLLGHGVSTTEAWLPAHLNVVMEALDSMA